MHTGFYCLTRKAAIGIIVPSVLLALPFSSCFSGGKDKSSAKNTNTSDYPVYSDTTRLKQINVPGNFVYGAVLDDLDKSNLGSIDLALRIFCNNRADSLSRDSMLVSFNEFMNSAMQEYFDNKLLGNKELTDHFGNKENQADAQKLTQTLATHGIHLNFNDGEFYLEPDLSFIRQRLGKVLTSSSMEYLTTRIKLARNFSGFSSGNKNQALSIPDSIAFQFVTWEDFLAKYPGYVMKDDIHSQYLDALTAYLSGLEQMPLFDPDTKKIDPNYLTSYQHFIESNPTRESARVVKKFYELLTRKGFKYDEAMDTFLSEEILVPIPKTE